MFDDDDDTPARPSRSRRSRPQHRVARAEGLIRLRDLGLNPPIDYAITGFDDVDDAPASDLTSVTSERERIGRLGARLLHALASDPSLARQHTVLRPTLRVRASTGKEVPAKEAAVTRTKT